MSSNTTPQIDDDDVSDELAGHSLNPADFKGGRSRRFRIVGVEKKTFEAKNGRPAEVRRVLEFEGGKKLPLNKTNLGLMVEWFGPHPSSWIGKDVAVLRDESVSFAGQRVGGWRLRKPSKRDLAGAKDDEEDAVF